MACNGGKLQRVLSVVLQSSVWVAPQCPKAGTRGLKPPKSSVSFGHWLPWASSYDGKRDKIGFAMRTSKSDTVGGCRNSGESPGCLGEWGSVTHDTGVRCQFLDGKLSGPDIQSQFPRRVAVWKLKGTFLISEGEEHTKEKPRWYMIHCCFQYAFPVSPLLPHCCYWQASGAPAAGVRDVEGAFDSRFAMICLYFPNSTGKSIYFPLFSSLFPKEGDLSIPIYDCSFPVLEATQQQMFSQASQRSASLPTLHPSRTPSEALVGCQGVLRVEGSHPEGWWNHLQLWLCWSAGCKIYCGSGWKDSICNWSHINSQLSHLRLLTSDYFGTSGGISSSTYGLWCTWTASWTVREALGCESNTFVWLDLSKGLDQKGGSCIACKYSHVFFKEMKTA